jgi:hypothetical protein
MRSVSGSFGFANNATSAALGNLLVTSYPLVMVPTFAVPLALMLHGLVLWRLRRGAASAERLAAA